MPAKNALLFIRHADFANGNHTLHGVNPIPFTIHEIKFPSEPTAHRQCLLLIDTPPFPPPTPTYPKNLDDVC